MNVLIHEEITDNETLAQFDNETKELDELNKIGKDTALTIEIKRKKKNKLNVRRKTFQLYEGLEKVHELTAILQAEAKSLKKLDDLQDFREIMFNIARAKAHLRRISKNNFSRYPEELEVYK